MTEPLSEVIRIRVTPSHAARLGEAAALSQPTPGNALLYRIPIAETKLGVSRSTIYRLVNEGELELVKISKRSSGITAASLHALGGVNYFERRTSIILSGAVGHCHCCSLLARGRRAGIALRRR